jgi:hypothetical protein
MPPRSPFPMFSSSSESRVALLQSLMIGVIIVGMLYIARDVLLPLALWLRELLGLLLAMPLAVCLVVLGRHIRGLVLLGDKLALTPAQSFYQRALIGDSAEALVDHLDEVALASLKLAERDAERGSLDAENLGKHRRNGRRDDAQSHRFRATLLVQEGAYRGEVDETPGGLASQLAGVLQRQGLKARALPSDRPLTSFRLKPPRRNSLPLLSRHGRAARSLKRDTGGRQRPKGR